MKKSVIIATGSDAHFYPYLKEALDSLLELGIDRKVEIGVVDLGLTPEQLQALSARGFIVRSAQWLLPGPSQAQNMLDLGYAARMTLRDYFEGFATYIWFDADAWAQTPEFFALLMEGAAAQGIAVIRENGNGYRRSFLYQRWWLGHMMAAYGIGRGMKLGIRPAINNGILALSDKAPHWTAWARHYAHIITKRGKLNLEQHALNAAIELENLPYALLPARCNWICTLSAPAWDDERALFCEPDSAAPLSVLHLAGPDKCRAYAIDRMQGGAIKTPLTFAAYRALKERRA